MKRNRERYQASEIHGSLSQASGATVSDDKHNQEQSVALLVCRGIAMGRYINQIFTYINQCTPSSIELIYTAIQFYDDPS